MTCGKCRENFKFGQDTFIIVNFAIKCQSFHKLPDSMTLDPHLDKKKQYFLFFVQNQLLKHPQSIEQIV